MAKKKQERDYFKRICEHCSGSFYLYEGDSMEPYCEICREMSDSERETAAILERLEEAIKKWEYNNKEVPDYQPFISRLKELHYIKTGSA